MTVLLCVYDVSGGYVVTGVGAVGVYGFDVVYGVIG